VIVLARAGTLRACSWLLTASIVAGTFASSKSIAEAIKPTPPVRRASVIWGTRSTSISLIQYWSNTVVRLLEEARALRVNAVVALAVNVVEVVRKFVTGGANKVSSISDMSFRGRRSQGILESLPQTSDVWGRLFRVDDLSSPFDRFPLGTERRVRSCSGVAALSRSLIRTPSEFELSEARREEGEESMDLQK